MKSFANTKFVFLAFLLVRVEKIAYIRPRLRLHCKMLPFQ